MASFNNGMLAPYSLARNGLAFEAGDFPKSPLALSQREALAKALSGARAGAAAPTEEELAVLRTESNNWTVHGSRTASGSVALRSGTQRGDTIYLHHDDARQQHHPSPPRLGSRFAV